MNVDWISRQFDYLSFANGIFLATLFLICFLLHGRERDRPEKPSWLLFGLFAWILGLREWSELVSLLGFEGAITSSLGLLLTALAYLFLLEFGRRATPRLAGARAARALYGTLLVLSLSGLPYGLNGLGGSVRYFLALPSGIIAAGAFFLEFKRRPPGERSFFLLLSVTIALLAFSTVAGAPESGFAPAGLVNDAAFFKLTGYPVLLLRGLLALAITLLLSWYSVISARRGRGSFSGLAMALAILATIGCGWYFTGHQGRRAARELETTAQTDVGSLVGHIANALRTADMTALDLAEYPALIAALESRKQDDISATNLLLDQHQRNMNLAVCYLMDREGLTIASSNRGAADSFAGKSYAFRPYFTEAIAGRPGKYFALGVTSGERGYYTGFPVSDAAGRTLGVVVAKRGVDDLTQAFREHLAQFLVSPEGVIFLAGRKDDLSRTLWPVDAGRRAALSGSKQFGPVSFAPLLEGEPLGNSYLKKDGRVIYVVRVPINVPGWSVVLLHDTTAISVSRLQGIGITFVVSVVIMFAFMLLVSSENSLQISLKLLELQRSNEKALNEQLHLQQFISMVSRTLQSTKDVSIVLHQETEIVVGHLGAAFARIWTLNQTTNLLELQASGGLYTNLDGPHARIPVGQGKIGQIVQEGKPA